MIAVAAVGYSVVGVLFVILAVLLATSWRGQRVGGYLIGACVVNSLWAALLTVQLFRSGIDPLWLFVGEIARTSSWIIFVVYLLGQIGYSRAQRGIAILACLLALGSGLALWAGQRWFGLSNSIWDVLIPAGLVLALLGLVLIEQLYRNSPPESRWGLKALVLGLGGIFAYDLFLYSQAVLFNAIDSTTWLARGAVNILFVPAIAVAARRNPDWKVRIFVSRQIVFYSTTLVAVGLYLLVMSFGGYLLLQFGGSWGALARTVFFVGAGLILFTLLFSNTLRARLKVFLNKHFFHNKYDYREEWLRLISTLTSSDLVPELRMRAIKSLAQILESPRGVLWLRNPDSNGYHCASGWNTECFGGVIAGDDSLVRFLENTQWVIDLREYSDDAGHYDGLEVATGNLGLADATFVVPLLHDSGIIGFVVLSSASTPTILNYEDRDLLKTAGQQVASYLAQELTNDQLTEARQFEAFSRLTAYLMHDLKNVIAQQSLVVENAKKHKNNPQFIDDAVETIKSSVSRMRKILEHFGQSSTEHRLQRVELGKVIMQAIAQCSDRRPVPTSVIGRDKAWVRADSDRLLMAISHAIRNAQDATGTDGDVSVTLEINDGNCCVKIIDSGEGMDEAFIRERLFKPFDSTKGTQGMGIGAYQIRETLRAMGGEVTVTSEPGGGTVVALEIAHLD